MENSPKRLKLELSIDESCRQSQQETNTTIEKVPEEVLEMILTYVPCKEYCFLVNKMFQKAAVGASRNRIVLTVDKNSVND